MQRSFTILVLVGDTGSGFTKGAYNSWKTMPDSDMKGSVLVLVLQIEVGMNRGQVVNNGKVAVFACGVQAGLSTLVLLVEVDSL